ncbi:DUF6694 family lipoprotein [Pseudomonas putida]|uniref:Lipoprotein n=1 Tax=Pseudomonas putida TaxID=303 RepID=A0A8I1JK72_PSEPU|nr:DUF6694 family lipoprotein [Pseudomonas putida]MBI6883150.1 hypothetical protein [Pseudomonas putida]
MLFKKAILPMVIMAALTGCGPAVLDGTSLDTLDESIAKIAEKLPEDQRPQFGEDMGIVKAYYEKQRPDQMLINLNGKNASDIASEAGNLREQQRVEQEKLAVEEQKRAYLADLNQKKAALVEEITPLEQSRAQTLDRAKFQVTEPRIQVLKTEKTGEAVNSIALTLVNGTSKEIYSANFGGELKAPGADQPALKADFDITLEQPLQPGETRDVLFVPPMISDWRSVTIPEGATFSVESEDLLNIANKPIFSLPEFSDEDQATLSKLYDDLKAVNSELGVAEGGDTVVPSASTPAAPESTELQSETPTNSAAEVTGDTTAPTPEISTPEALLPEADEDQKVSQEAAPADVPLEDALSQKEPEETKALKESADPVPSDPEPTAVPGETQETSPAEAKKTDATAPVSPVSPVSEAESQVEDGTPASAIAEPEKESSVPSVGNQEAPVTPLKSS